MCDPKVLVVYSTALGTALGASRSNVKPDFACALDKPFHINARVGGIREHGGITEPQFAVGF